MSRTTLQLAARTARNRLSGRLALGVFIWCLASPLPVGVLSNFAGFTDVIEWHWWLPAAAHVVAVVLNLPTPRIPTELVRKLDDPDGLRVGRPAMFGYGLGAAIVVQAQHIALTYDDPWLAVFGSGPFPAVVPAAWVLLASAGLVALRSLAGALGWVPDAWQEVTEGDLRAKGGRR